MSAATGRRFFLASAGAALALHAVLLWSGDPLDGGADLRPHLRLVQLMGEAPALRSVYAPFYHGLGALLAPWIGLSAYPRVFAFASAIALIAAFRFFQRAAALPDASAAIFPWTPYLFALTWCTPKVEAAGYAVAFAGLGLLLRGRRAWLAAAVVAAFLVHTAAALFLGLCGGVLAAVRRDRGALVALAVGSACSTPLFAAHLAAGCSLAEAFLFSPGDYLREGAGLASLARWETVLVLAGPIALGAAAVGAPRLWRERRDIAFLCLLVVGLYANELWLAPFGARTTLDLLRGLTVLAFPVAIAAGFAAEARPLAVAGACAAFAAAAAWLVVPDACFVRTHDVAEITATDVDRCTFRWHGSDSRGR